MSISQCKIGEQVVEPRVWLKGELGSRRRWIKKRLDISKMTLSFDKLVLPGVTFCLGRCTCGLPCQTTHLPRWQGNNHLELTVTSLVVRFLISFIQL